MHKKNGFLNFCFSCLPGAGQMYQGFMKRGTSIMLIFFGFVTLIAYLRIDELLFLLPVIWCYGFFDSIHCNSLPDSEYSQLRDEFLFVEHEMRPLRLRKFRIPVAVLLIIFGVYSLIRMFVNSLYYSELIPWDSDIMFFVDEMLPKVGFSVAIIGLGVYLICGKTKETFQEDLGGNMFYRENHDLGSGFSMDEPGFPENEAREDLTDEPVQEEQAQKEEDGGEEE